MKKGTITQLIHRYGVIDEETNEWLYEAATYGECVSMVKAVVKKGKRYLIVAIMKDATNK